MRNAAIPIELYFSQSQEFQLNLNESKVIKSEFVDLKKKIIHSFNTKDVRRKKFNLPKRLRDALKHLKQLVREKVNDIRKVDKGQWIVVIDYAQRKLI